MVFHSNQSHPGIRIQNMLTLSSIVKIATFIGINKAILLYTLQSLSESSRRLNINYKDGFYWAVGSFETLKDTELPYLSSGFIKSMIYQLEKQEYLFISKDTSRPFDRTNWYRINEEKLQKLINL